MAKDYIFLALGCAVVGVVTTFVVLGVCVRFGIDIEKSIWVVAIPAVFSIILNVSLLEIYRKFRRNKTGGWS